MLNAGVDQLGGKMCFFVLLAVVEGESVCLCECCHWRVERMLFFLLLWDWSSQPAQCALPALQPWMGSTSSHSLRGADLTSLHWQIRHGGFGQRQSCTIQMLISNYRVVPRCLLLRFDCIPPEDPTWPNQIPTAYLQKPCWWLKYEMVITMAFLCMGFSSGKMPCLCPFGRAGWSYGLLLAVLSLFLMHLLCLLMRNAML